MWSNGFLLAPELRPAAIAVLGLRLGLGPPAAIAVLASAGGVLDPLWLRALLALALISIAGAQALAAWRVRVVRANRLGSGQWRLVLVSGPAVVAQLERWWLLFSWAGLAWREQSGRRHVVLLNAGSMSEDAWRRLRAGLRWPVPFAYNRAAAAQHEACDAVGSFVDWRRTFRPSGSLPGGGRSAGTFQVGRQFLKNGDQRLVERARKGDRQAFDLLVLKYQHKIVKLIMRYVRDPAEALDVSQEAFVKAYKAIPRFRGDSAFYTWLYRIAINTAKNHLVSMSRRPLEYDLDLQAAEQTGLSQQLRDDDSPEGLVMRDELREAVEAAIGDLAEELRIAITLREIEGLSYEEIAQAMDCPVGTVRSRIFRARDAISERIGPLLDGGNPQ